VILQPAVPAAAVLPARVAPVVEAPPVVTPVTPPPLQWETPPQGKSPFSDLEPVPAPLFEPEPAKPCTKEAFDRGMCVTR
jgi:hypothetical protein